MPSLRKDVLHGGPKVSEPVKCVLCGAATIFAFLLVVAVMPWAFYFMDLYFDWCRSVTNEWR